VLVLDSKFIALLDMSLGEKGLFGLHSSLQILLLQCISNGLSTDSKGEMGLGLGCIINLPRGDRTCKVLSVLGGELGRTSSRRCWECIGKFRAKL